MSSLKKYQKRTADSKNKAKSYLTSRSARFVYCLPRKSRKAFVDLVLTIMDSDGPQPMRNMRPVEKQRTGADQFSAAHHGEYEARGQQSRDKVQRVLAHNKACPKMYDELEKRRSTGKPVLNTTTARRSVMSFETNSFICIDCKRHEKDLKRRKHYMRLIHRHSKRFKIKKVKTLSKIMKHKRIKLYKYPSKLYQLPKSELNKNCQCATRDVPRKKKCPPKKLSAVKMNAPNIARSTKGLVLKNVTSSIYYKKDTKNIKSDTDSGYSYTISPRSQSSYNSFMSMEHEPMVK